MTEKFAVPQRSESLPGRGINRDTIEVRYLCEQTFRRASGCAGPLFSSVAGTKEVTENGRGLVNGVRVRAFSCLFVCVEVKERKRRLRNFELPSNQGRGKTRARAGEGVEEKLP